LPSLDSPQYLFNSEAKKECFKLCLMVQQMPRYCDVAV